MHKWETSGPRFKVIVTIGLIWGCHLFGLWTSAAGRVAPWFDFITTIALVWIAYAMGIITQRDKVFQAATTESDAFAKMLDGEINSLKSATAPREVE